MTPDDDALTEAENQFFESGGEIAPEQSDEAETEAPEDSEDEAPEQDDDTSADDADGDDNADDLDEPLPKSDEDGKVPHGALHEERERRKELAAELAEQRERAAKMEQRLQDVLEKVQQPAEPTQPEISFDDDPAEYLRQRTAELESAQAKTNEWQEQQAQQANQQQMVQHTIGRYQNDAQAYAAEHPEFQDAYKHVSESRTAEYLAAGYTQEQALQYLQEDEFAIVTKAYQDGVNPAERLMGLAKARGWQPAANDDPPVETAEQKVERIEKGQQAAKSMRGKAPPNMSLEALAEMDDEAFNEHWDEIVSGGKKAPF